jgi:26S proteasome regulatory subunit N9
MKELVHLN